MNGPSKSAALVAACRLLAAELPEPERLIRDPLARLVTDNEAVASARADEPLQRVIRLRTRYIDDAVTAFTDRHDGRAGFEIVNDEATEALATSYGLELRPRHYPTRMVLARRI